MLEYAGVPVVMANAIAELAATAKERGWAVALSNEQCGVAHAIRRYALADSSDGKANGRH